MSCRIEMRDDEIEAVVRVLDGMEETYSLADGSPLARGHTRLKEALTDRLLGGPGPDSPRATPPSACDRNL